MMSGNASMTEVLTLFTPSELIGIDLRGTVTIVIDVLRGSSTIIYALKNGASRIIPAEEIDVARDMADEWPTGEYLLCAERNGVRVEGFNLGNSPFEYDPAVVAGKDIIYSSTNCSKALIASYKADRVLIGTFNNITAVLDSIEFPARIMLVCGGKMGRFALEDSVCAGMFVNEILKLRKNDAALNDASRTAKILFDHYHRDILQLLKESSHGNYLCGLGMARDLEVASLVDSERIVPELSLDKTYFFSSFVPKHSPAEKETSDTNEKLSFNTTSLHVDSSLDGRAYVEQEIPGIELPDEPESRITAKVIDEGDSIFPGEITLS
jgi:2-phosphosulfolactate phosphatase